jgi:hypothetical protein
MTDTSPQTLDADIREIFSRETEDGNTKRGSIFWTHNGRNVGGDVLTALVEAKHCLKTPEATSLTLSEAIARLEAAHDRYRLGYEDEDGFGSATFHAIRRTFYELASRHGAGASFDPHIV